MIRTSNVCSVQDVMPAGPRSTGTECMPAHIRCNQGQRSFRLPSYGYVPIQARRPVPAVWPRPQSRKQRPRGLVMMRRMNSTAKPCRWSRLLGCARHPRLPTCSATQSSADRYGATIIQGDRLLLARQATCPAYWVCSHEPCGNIGVKARSFGRLCRYSILYVLQISMQYSLAHAPTSIRILQRSSSYVL